MTSTNIENSLKSRLNEDIEKLANDILKAFEDSKWESLEFKTNTKNVYAELENDEILIKLTDID